MAVHPGTLGVRTSQSLARLNTTWHERALWAFGGIVVLHWVEHIVQALQIWVLSYEKRAALGLLGAAWPWLVRTEWLHYGFAVVMAAGLVALAPGFAGRARFFWVVALVIQVWHLVEHQILFVQAQTGSPWFGAAVPTSVLQHVWPMARPEIHLVYNMLVTVPMLVALWFHMYPPLGQRGRATACTCDRTRTAEAAA